MKDITISSTERLQKELNEKIGAIVYFSAPTCNVCKVLRPKIMEMFSQEFSDIGRFYVNVPDSRELAAHYGVFTVPTILVFLDGQEFARESRNVSLAAMKEKIRRPYEIMKS